jgi:trk system potassium uptake protein TrkH
MRIAVPGSSVIDWRSIYWVLGAFLGVLALCMLLPLGYDLLALHQVSMAFVDAVAATACASVVLLLAGFRHERPALKQREGILLVVLIWLASCVFGALPFYFSAYFPSYADAFFESASGFTTTGATVLAVLEDLPADLHLWRAFSHWLGGMGIVLLSIAILPLIGQGGSDLYRAEFSGALAEKLQPRVIETARTLWRIYLALTAALFVALLIAGMGVFDAVCHAFSTLATGGFSTRTASIGAFDDPLIEYIIILFMLLAGISFVQHYRLWVERRVADVTRDYEIRAYLLLVLLAAAVIAIVLLREQQADSPTAWESSIRQALFQAVSIVTTTGFVTADYAQWQPVAQLILLSLMFVGGCTGSTAGGLKVARVKLMMKVIGRDFRQLSEPQGVFRIHLGGAAIPELTVSAMLNLVYLALFAVLAASLVLASQGLDLLTAVSAVIACQFNVGPGLGGVGPASNYAALSELSKWVLALSMVAGRLEFYTFFFVLTGAFWRR